MDLTDEKLHEIISNNLNEYPELRKALPEKYPTSNEYGITVEKLQSYSLERTIKFWSHMNLPLCLSDLDGQRDPKAKELVDSWLSLLNRFCLEFKEINKYRSVLSPLYKSAWDLGDPCFWSVLGETSLALFLLDNKKEVFPVIGFEESIGDGTRTSDIKTNFKGKVVHLDIEIKNIRDEYPDNPETIRNWVTANAMAKMDKKFKDLPADEFGMVAQIYMFQENNLAIFEKYKSAFAPVLYKDRINQSTNIYIFVGGRMAKEGGEGKFGLYLCDYEIGNYKLIRSKP